MLLKSLPADAQAPSAKSLPAQEPKPKAVPSELPAPQEKRGEAGPPPAALPAETKRILKTEDEILADPDFKACSNGTPTQVSDCDRAIASGKFDDEISGLLYDLRGGANLGAKAFDRAIEDFTRAITHSPSSAKYYGHRASGIGLCG